MTKNRSLKFLHLAHDEKFIDMGIESFERIKFSSNDLYLISENNRKYVKRNPKKILNKFDALLGITQNEISNYDLIIIHSLSPYFYRIIMLAKTDTPILWIGWGSDYYDLIYKNKSDLLLPKTLATEKSNDFSSQIKNLLIKILLPNKEKVIERINFFSPVLPNEYDLVKSNFSKKTFPKKSLWNYGNLEDNLIKGFPDQWVNGPSILLGNSASSSNNHLDALEFLSRKNITDKKIISPLSYGDKKYRDLIINEGNKLFGANFSPLIKYMPIEEYIKEILSCEIVIMNHIRQQAVGNIISMLYLGAKVFLRKECPTFSYLISKNIKVFSLQDLEKDINLLKDPLNYSEKIINRNIIINIWSKNAETRKTQELIAQILHQECNMHL